MWSGPRNVSTALMRSFENRKDTFVIDEPFYAYYLNKTKKNHPLRDEIIKKYPNNEKDVIKIIMNNPQNNKLIYYQKHMTHHILDKTPIDWISKGINCFLLRDPKEVINSYIKKNNINDSSDIGFPSQLKIFEKANKFSKKTIVINSKDLIKDPENTLKKLCDKLNIQFNNDMLHWPKGKRETDGIWSKVWYENVINSTGFSNKTNNKKEKIILPKKYEKLYEECLEIYNLINKYKI